jgi:peptide/nickel transport system permease protein
VLIALLGGLSALMVTSLTTGLSNRRALYASLVTVAIGVALWYPLQFAFEAIPQIWFLFLLAILAIVVGVVVGFLMGKDDKWASARAAGITSFLVALLILVDRIMGAWPSYVQAVGGRPIATVGSGTPDLGGSIWVGMVDSYTHLLLPTISLVLISLAGYTRYARASLLEVMNQDYVRTARAKGLTERTVVMRHAFRNAMIPVITVVAFDVGGLIGGAVITETIFAWKGMGALFTDALHRVDVNTVMGVFLVIGIVAIVFNILADIAYTALDPRIRVS